MKFLAVCRPRDGAPPERFAELVPDEAEQAIILDMARQKIAGISLTQIARAAGLQRFHIATVSLLGWPTNLLLIAYKG